MEQELLDIKGLLHRTMNDLEFAKEVLNDYIAETPGMVHSLEEAISSGNLTECKNISHKLKGSSSSAGAIKMHLISGTLEKLSDSSNLEAIKNSYKDFKILYNLTIDCITNLNFMK